MDYNIYIHGDLQGGNGGKAIAQKFTPQSQKSESSQSASTFSKFANKAIQAGNKIANFQSTNILTESTNLLSKVPVVGQVVELVVATFKLVQKGVENSVKLYSTYSGDDITQMNYDNYRAKMKQLFSPFMYLQVEPTVFRKQYAVEQNRILSGNSYTGVGGGGRNV